MTDVVDSRAHTKEYPVNKIYVLCASLLVIFIGCSTASALTIVDRPDIVPSTNYGGEYLFTVTYPQNDNYDNEHLWNDADREQLELEIEKKLIFFNVTNFTFYAKVDAPHLRDNPSSFTTPIMEVSYKSSNTGTWSTTSAVDFYTVKGAKEFALYWLVGGATTANWSSEHLLNGGNEQPGMSHISTWTADIVRPPDDEEGPDPVPEPSTLLLMGAGIAGLAFYRRKKK